MTPKGLTDRGCRWLDCKQLPLGICCSLCVSGTPANQPPAGSIFTCSLSPWSGLWQTCFPSHLTSLAPTSWPIFSTSWEYGELEITEAHFPPLSWAFSKLFIFSLFPGSIEQVNKLISNEKIRYPYPVPADDLNFMSSSPGVTLFGFGEQRDSHLWSPYFSKMWLLFFSLHVQFLHR